MTEVTLGPCRLICGDCLDVIPLPGIDAVISDPPYGVGFSHGGNDNSGIGAGRYATKFNGVKIIGDDTPFDPTPLLKLGLPLAMWGGNHFAHLLPASSQWWIWDKRAASGHTNDFADCEMAWTSGDGVARVFRHHWDGMMKASEHGEPRVHPTQKPVALMEWCLHQPGFECAKSILDPYMGSASTAIACIRTGRSFVGIEKDPKHFATAVDRIKRELSQPMLFPVVTKHEQPSLLGIDSGNANA